MRMSEAASVIKSIWVPSLVSVGTILNLLTIMVFCRRRMRKYCISISMMCLAIADTAVLLIPVLLTWIDEHFFASYYVNNTVWCNLHGYFDLVSCANSSWIILLISIERWFAVCRPWHKNQIFTSRMVTRTLLFIFFASIVLFVYFPLSLRLDSDKAECQIEHQQVYRIMGTVSVILVYVMPFFMLAILNVMIIIRLKQRPFQSASISASRPSIMPSRSQRSPSQANTAGFQTGGGLLMPNSSTYDELSSTNGVGSSLRRPSEFRASITTTPPLINHPSTATSFAATSNTSKNDRNLSITLVTLAITFMIFTFPFQAHWFYENIYKMLVSADGELSSSSSSFQIEVNNQTDAAFIKTSNDEENAIEEETESVNMVIREVTFMIKNMNYLINFFLYSLLSKLFRQELLAMMGGGSDKTGSGCLKKLPCSKLLSGRKRAEDASSSSFAELSFSVEAFKSLKRGQYRNSRRKLFFFKVEPANFFEYFRQVGEAKKAAAALSNSRDAKLLKLEKELLNSRAETRHQTSNAEEPVENNNIDDIRSLDENEVVRKSIDKSIRSVDETGENSEEKSGSLRKSKTCDAILVNNKSKLLIKFTRISTKADPKRPIGHV